MTRPVPDLSALTPHQRAAVELPFDASYVITGGPGTGKTTTAVHRAAALHASSRPTVMLTFNKVLNATLRAVPELAGVEIATYHSWFHGFWQSLYRRSPPSSGRYGIDWPACFAAIGSDPPPARDRYLVVDEGQDLPNGFYLVMRALAARLTVFADQSQRINEQQSTVQEIAVATAATTLTLPTNHRNSGPVAELADHILPAPAADLHGLPDGPRPRLIRHGATADAIEHILRHEKDHPSETIGVVLNRNRDLHTYYHQLEGRALRPVQAYASGYKTGPFADPAFTGPGIKIVSSKSVKGLGFDTVFVPELQTLAGDPESEAVRMQLYVLTTRARRNLTYMYTGEGEPLIVAALPRHLIELEGDGAPPSEPDGDRGAGPAIPSRHPRS